MALNHSLQFVSFTDKYSEVWLLYTSWPNPKPNSHICHMAQGAFFKYSLEWLYNKHESDF